MISVRFVGKLCCVIIYGIYAGHSPPTPDYIH